VRAHARPRNRKTVRVQIQIAHECYIVAVAVVVIGSYRTVITIKDGATHPREGVPDRVGSAVLVCGTFNLVRGSCGSPQKTGRERAAGAGVGMSRMHYLLFR